MTTVRKLAAQGDLLIRRIEALPGELVERSAVDGVHVVAHSETGHHHTLPSSGVAIMDAPSSRGMLAYAVVTEPATLTHHRPWDTHRPLTLEPGIYELRRQREYTPTGWRRVED